MKGLKANTTPIQKVNLQLPSSIELYIKRIDMVHPTLSGNKFYKLKYNVEKAIEQNKKTLITFGGAYSNHITAVSNLSKIINIPTVGIIRGEELENKNRNPSLQIAEENGMKLFFISRDEYRLKEKSTVVQELIQSFKDPYLIPEGGTNDLAVKGCMEILDKSDLEFDIICTAVGTGGTLSGLSLAAAEKQQVIGFPALKNADFLAKEIIKFSSKNNFQLDLRYHFGGYGKYNAKLVDFIQAFNQKHNIPLDIVYTSKMMYGIIKNITNKEYPEGSKIVAIHTGGLQGNPKTLQQNLHSI